MDLSTGEGLGKLLSNLIQIVPRVVERAIRAGLTRDGDQTKTGGWFFALIPTRFGLVPLKFPVGEVPPTSRSPKNSEEKAWRNHREGTTTSFEPRNPELEQWGGAVSVGLGIQFSFSGFREEIDEIVDLVTARLLDLSDGPEAERIVTERGSRDEYLELLARCQDLRPAA